ncbi:MAG: ribulose-phosphate 3-epimerase [Candidatus Saganbacteria bacterium]|nr:ribulose-phosphate 3-epimerase [Candidatus Saganbacteria bacterium]
MVKIAPSILSSDFRNLEAEIQKVEKAGADLIHVDVMDGHFVPNITMGPLVVYAVRKVTKLPLDVHLMIENPEKYIEAFAKAGADIIGIHAEASKNMTRDIAQIKKLGCKACITINPGTSVKPILRVLDKVDMVLVMSVHPGFEKQVFMTNALGKIKALRKIATEKGLNLDIEVDGGINSQTAHLAIQAGANVLVAGSAIFYAKSAAKAIRELRESKHSRPLPKVPTSP